MFSPLYPKHVKLIKGNPMIKCQRLMQHPEQGERSEGIGPICWALDGQIDDTDELLQLQNN